MSRLLDQLLNLRPLLVYLIVPALVFAEDALFIGFVIPGETAAVLGGVDASRGHVRIWLVVVLVVLAAIVGDTVGYEFGRHIGGRLLRLPFVQRWHRLAAAEDYLRRRGGSAVFFGRFVAFFRAVMPALAGAARMPYRRFVFYNAAGGVVWGVGFVLLGYLAGNSYKKVERSVGRDVAVALVVVVVLVFVAWRGRKRRAQTDGSPEDAA